MTTAILTINAGSSSLKVALFPMDGDAPLATALADKIGAEGILRLRDRAGNVLPAAAGELSSHERALSTVIASFRLLYPTLDVRAVGHRVVHGGPAFDTPVVFDAAVMEALAVLEDFAPLHQPHNLAGIRAAMTAFPGVPQVACFDTAFHRGHPWVNDAFALPREFYDSGVRRYGFHGLSYDYVAGRLKELAPNLAAGRVVVAHLGNGASVCAISNGQSVASTMGFTALDGLVMGTRCGSIDPGVILYLAEQRGMSPSEISDLLYKKSGLLGLSGLSNDMRTLEASEAEEARQAIDFFVASAQREIAGMAAAMGGIDALVFCGGIGENSRRIRAEICGNLGWMGIELDSGLNAANETVISADGSRTAVLVVPTNEELVIARAARSFA